MVKRVTCGAAGFSRIWRMPNANNASTAAAQRPTAVVIHAKRSRRPDRGIPSAAPAAGDASASAMSSRASRMSPSRCRGSFTRHRRNSRVTRIGVPDGSVPQFGSLLMICGQRLRHALPLEGAYAGQHFIDHDPECPHIGVPVDGATQSLFRRHVRSAAEDDADVRPVRAHGRRVHHVDRSGCVHVERLRQPEIQHFHTPHR